MIKDDVIVKTKFIGATDDEGAKVFAWGPTGLAWSVAYDHALGVTANHRRAAETLVALGDVLVGESAYMGETADGTGMRFRVAFTLDSQDV